MALLKTQGLVLRRLKYGETSLIADIYTEQKGLHSFIAGGVRKAKTSMPLSLFQAMYPVDIVSYFKEGSEKLHRIKEIRPSLILQRVPFELPRGAVAMFMAEICQKTIVETEGNPHLFSFLINYVEYLDNTSAPLPNLHLHFLIHLTEHLGFQPSQKQGDEPFFDLREGSATYTAPSHKEYFSGEPLEHMYQLLSLKKETAHTLALEAPERKLLLQHLLHFYRLHSPGFTQINTPFILAQVFG